MSETSSPGAIPYVETTAFEWTSRAFELLGAKALKASPLWADGVCTVVVAGPCPRCAHHLLDRQVGVAVSGVAGGTRGFLLKGAPPPSTIVIEVTCGCGTTHEGAPERVTGCGVSFRIELVATDAVEASP